MDHGEIHLNAALLLINSLKSKTNLKVLDLNGNQFGEDGCTEVKGILTGAGKKSVLQSLRSVRSFLFYFLVNNLIFFSQ